jgi:hypothetical protein
MELPATRPEEFRPRSGRATSVFGTFSYLALLLGVPTALALYGNNAAAVILLAAVIVQYVRLRSVHSQLRRAQQFIWNSELRYDFYPNLLRPSEEDLLKFRRTRIESDPELLLREQKTHPKDSGTAPDST